MRRLRNRAGQTTGLSTTRGIVARPGQSIRDGGTVTWSTETFATNQNANAIRFGTLYNFGSMRTNRHRLPTVQSVTLRLARRCPLKIQAPGPGRRRHTYTNAERLLLHPSSKSKSYCYCYSNTYSHSHCDGERRLLVLRLHQRLRPTPTATIRPYSHTQAESTARVRPTPHPRP